jgi:chromosome segregation ATPase
MSGSLHEYVKRHKLGSLGDFVDIIVCNEADSLHAQLEQAREHDEGRTERLAYLNGAIAQQHAEIVALREQLEESTRRFTSVQAVADFREQQTKLATDEIAALRSQLSEAQQEVREWDQTHQTQQQQNNEAFREIQALQKQLSEAREREDNCPMCVRNPERVNE